MVKKSVEMVFLYFQYSISHSPITPRPRTPSTSQRPKLIPTQLNHGIELSADGKTLYVSALAKVDQYTYDATAGTTSNKKTIITNMSNGGLHLTRTLLRSKKFPDLLLVQRGSDGNVDTGAKQISTGRSMIRVFNLTQISQTPVSYSTGGFLLAWGLRNAVGMGENPATGEIVRLPNIQSYCCKLTVCVVVHRPRRRRYKTQRQRRTQYQPRRKTKLPRSPQRHHIPDIRR